MSVGPAEVLRLEGALTMASVSARLAEGRARAARAALNVDLSGVTEADSAALALLLDWLRRARNAGHPMTVTGIPRGLRSLAALYGVDELLPFDAVPGTGP